MKLSELKGKPVVGVDEARKLGVVDDVLVDPSYQQIMALRVKTDGRGHGYLISSDQIKGIGRDAVTIPNKDALLIPDRAQQLAGLPSLSAVLHSRVVTEGGQLLGSVTEVDVDVPAKSIRAFEYQHSTLQGLLGRHDTIPISDVVGVGPGLITIREASRAAQHD